MAEHVSNIELARQFYQEHELDFRRVAQEAQEQRLFPYSAAQFDRWAAGHQYITCPAQEATTTAERYGITQRRHQIRVRLNLAARKGQGLPRAFSVEARGQKWRVVLGEKFLSEQPEAIVGGVRGSLNRSERAIEQVRGYLETAEHLEDAKRQALATKLEVAEMFIFQGLQMAEIITLSIAQGRRPNFRVLRQRMAKAVLASAK